jgi:hypothetical protein
MLALRRSGSILVTSFPQPDLPGLNLLDPGNRLKQNSLASAGGSQQDKVLTSLHRKADVVEGKSPSLTEDCGSQSYLSISVDEHAQYDEYEHTDDDQDNCDGAGKV